jgi:hypothetical protein
MKNNKNHLRMYHLLLKLFYPKKVAEVYRPELLRIRSVTVVGTVQLLLALAISLVLFGFPVSIGEDPPERIVLYTISFSGAVLVFDIFLGSLWFHVRRWTLTMLLHGSVSRKIFRTMRQARSYRAYTTESSPITAFIFACPLLAIYWWTKTPIAITLGLYAIYNCTLASALRMYLPPSALLLTASASDTVELHAHITYYFSAFRTAQLLKGDNSSKEFKVLARRDCFRTKNDDVWEKLVAAFIQICPIVVLDARQVTPALFKEFKRIAEANISHKLVVLVGEAGQRPLLEQLGIDLQKVFRHEVPVVREAGLLTLLNHVFVKFPGLPTEDCPFSVIIRSSHCWETIHRDEWSSRLSRPISGRN